MAHDRALASMEIAQLPVNFEKETMRELTDHKVNGLNEALEITVMDELGQGGACHEYRIELLKPAAIPEGAARIPAEVARSWHISFQNGPVNEFGFNGISQEALLAIVIDRLRSFQAGAFSTRENSIALTKCEEALLWLHKRTRDRMARGVEGTNVK